MLLKRIEIQGFKSFADKTVLDFDDGSTAIVGPNGSGKSNISDAIRWVIGEMSAKSLRGANMQDVIFSGTETRRPVNFAEVSLVLDNREHIFDIEFDEVVVTRRLFRSGESIYRINNADCRLKDIHELFMDTGLGRDGYSIIGQGNVAQILSTKAEDRRSIFEEAAGISKYKYRREETERKLRGVEENLIRIGDITSELEAQRAPLKKQSEKARKYLGLYSEYKELDVNLSLITIDKKRKNKAEADKLYKGVEDELSELRETGSETERKISLLYAQSESMDKELADKNLLLRESNEKAVENKNSIRIDENTIKNNNAMLCRIDAEIEDIRNKNTERGENIEKYKREIAQKQKTIDEILKKFDTASSEKEVITERKAVLEREIEELRGNAAKGLNEISSRKARIEGMEKLRGSFIERRSAIETEMNSFHEDVSDTRHNIEKCEGEIAEKTDKLNKVKAAVDRYNADLSRLTDSYNALTDKINALSVEFNSRTSKKKILEGMENDYAGYAKSVKTALKAGELKKLSIYGTVSGLIDVDKQYVTAIEMALGGAMQNIVVENEEDAKTAIEYLRRTNSGRATFLPVSSVRGRELENIREISSFDGFIGIASSLVKYDKRYDGIMKNLLGRVVVASDIENAIAMSRKFGYRFRVVTLEGDILNAGGSMSGGSVNKQSGFLSRAAEIKTLGSEINKLSSEIRERNADKERVAGDMRMTENQLSSYLPLVREYEDEILRLTNTKKHLEHLIESGNGTEQSLASELEQIEKRLSDSSEEMAELLQSLRTLEKTSAAARERVELLTAELDDITRESEEKAQNVMDKTMTLAALKKDIDIIQNTIANTKQEISGSEYEIASKENDRENIFRENDNLYTRINESRAASDSLQRQAEEIEKDIKETERKKGNIFNSMQTIRQSNKDLTDRLLALQQELSRLENRRSNLDTEIERITNRLWEDYELTYSSACEVKTGIDNEKSAFERLAELKSQIKSIGSVNMDAIEEYKSVEERFSFLSEQKEDLEKSRTELGGIITSMQELMEEHFEKRFKSINTSFGEVFKELFGGGRAELILSDPSDVLESGIEIEVQLPGKGRQNINLYSGGEKSFIAIALLFAILRVKPAPFCILDEIDAALDDVNVSRFATYLKNYIEQTQFIVITHRRGTMEAANILYGVTMQEKGVSKLLSLHIDDVDEDMVS